MKFVTYAATPGLKRFPESERFRVYRSAYKRLREQDSEFRKRMNRFKISIVAATVILLVVQWTSEFIISRGNWQTALGFAWIFVPALGYVVYVLVSSFRIQAFQNEQIDRFLQTRAA